MTSPLIAHFIRSAGEVFQLDLLLRLVDDATLRVAMAERQLGDQSCPCNTDFYNPIYTPEKFNYAVSCEKVAAKLLKKSYLFL